MSEFWNEAWKYLAGGGFVAAIIAVFRFIGSGRRQDAAEFVRLTTRIVSLESKHEECMKESGGLKAKVAVLEANDRHKDDKIAELQADLKGLRDWRHDIAGQAQVIVANAAADKLGLPPVTPVSGPRDGAA